MDKYTLNYAVDLPSVAIVNKERQNQRYYSTSPRRHCSTPSMQGGPTATTIISTKRAHAVPDDNSGAVTDTLE